MLKKIKCWYILLFSSIICNPIIVYAGDEKSEGGKTADDYNLLKNLFGKEAATMSLQDTAIVFARYMYNLIFIVSGAFIGYRFIKALVMYMKQDVTQLNRKQMINEILEPFAGMVLLILGWPLVAYFVKMTFGIDIGPLGD